MGGIVRLIYARQAPHVPYRVSVAAMKIINIAHLNTFFLRGPYFRDFVRSVMSAVAKKLLCWRKDLAEFRGLSEQERTGFLLVLEWFENFRMRNDLEANREAAKIFWRTEVLREDRPRQEWQIHQWGDAIQWSRIKASPHAIIMIF